MGNYNSISRRAAVKSSVFGLMAVSIPNILFSKEFSPLASGTIPGDKIFHRYPSVDDEIVGEVVGVSHFNFDRVKELVNNRPELARATWDWAFGDWETALGAASHVGRRDIAEFLMSHGARPDIFTFAMLGRYDAVKIMIKSIPNVETIRGPHGISLLSHAKAGLRSNYGWDLSPEQIEESNKLVAYLETLGTADQKDLNLEMKPDVKEKYIGDYMYGDDPKDGLTVKLNMRKDLALGKLGNSGGSLFQKSPNVFSYNGTTSIEIRFTVENGKVVALTITEPDLSLTAKKV